jgi:hypothetical protein
MCNDDGPVCALGRRYHAAARVNLPPPHSMVVLKGRSRQGPVRWNAYFGIATTVCRSASASHLCFSTASARKAFLETQEICQLMVNRGTYFFRIFRGTYLDRVLACWEHLVQGFCLERLELALDVSHRLQVDEGV